jgi:hypothetical protein
MSPAQRTRCVLSHSRNARSTRVCQPLPAALNFATTSGESRMVIFCLGASDRGRPRTEGRRVTRERQARRSVA